MSFNSIKINNSDTNYTHSIFDISKYTGNQYPDLSSALTDVPTEKQSGGMTVRYVQSIPAKYTVVKTENLTEQPTGTEISSNPYIASGTYTATELSAFSTLPATLNSSLTYYLTVTETVDEQEVTTYTSWVITYTQSADNKYVQYRLMSNSFNTAVANWQGVDNEPATGSDNLVKSGGIKNYVLLKSENIYFIGEGTGFVYSIFNLKVVAGNTYEIALPQTSWDYGTTNTSATVFEYGYFSNGNKTRVGYALYKDGLILNKKYTISIPADAGEDAALYIGGRAANNIEIHATITDISNIKDIRNILSKCVRTDLTSDFTQKEKQQARENIQALYNGVINHAFVTPPLQTASEYIQYSFNNGKKYKITYNFGNTHGRIMITVRSQRNQSSASVVKRLLDVTDGITKGEVEYECTDDNALYLHLYCVNDTEIELQNNTSILEIDSISGEVAIIKDKTDYIGNCVGDLGGKYSFSGQGNKTQIIIFPVNQGEEYTVVLNKTDWRREEVPASNNIFFITGNNITYATYIRTSLLPSDGRINFIPQGENVSISFRGDVGETLSIELVKTGDLYKRIVPIEETINNIINNTPISEDIVSLNGGVFELESKFKALTKRHGIYGDAQNGNKICVLLYTSDIHNSTDSLSRILQFYNTFDSYIDDILHGGDIVGDQFYQDNPFANVDGGEKVLTVIGNHDNWDVNNVEGDSINGRVLPTKVFAKFIGPYYEEWGVNIPDGASENGYCYWYKDYDDSKLRLVGLNCMNWDDTQANWLSSILNDSITKQYHVVIVNHYCPNSSSWNGIRECTFNTLYSTPSVSLNPQAIQIVQNAIDAGLVFVCWLFGHQHLDMLGNFSDYPLQYAFAVDKTALGQGWERDTVRLQTGRTQDSFNIIGFDTTLGIMSIIRIGNNRDKFMRQKNYLAFDYINRKIVGNS